MPEKQKNLNEIFDKEFYFLQNFFHHKTTPPRLKEIIISCMQQAADSVKPDISVSNKISLRVSYKRKLIGEEAGTRIEQLKHAFDGRMLDNIDLKVNINTTQDIDDLILLLKYHRDCLHVAGKNISEL